MADHVKVDPRMMHLHLSLPVGSSLQGAEDQI